MILITPPIALDPYKVDALPFKIYILCIILESNLEKYIFTTVFPAIITK